jgi:hypothetical protein
MKLGHAAACPYKEIYLVPMPVLRSLGSDILNTE